MLWYFLTFISVSSLLGAIYSLVVYPDEALVYFWNGLIPIVPIILFFAAGFWRNICPVAFLSQLPQLLNISFKKKLPPWLVKHGFSIAFILLFVTVIARKFVFNTDAQLLITLIIFIGISAFLSGLIWSGKSGWCTSMCPIYPVERLYGQNPFFSIKNCFISTSDSCTNCTTRCFDKVRSNNYMYDTNGDKISQQRNRKLFTGIFPGFILGYFVVPDYPTLPIPLIYLGVIIFSISTLMLFYLLEKKFAQSGINTLAALFAVLALNIYYFFTIPTSFNIFFGDTYWLNFVGGGLHFIIFSASMMWVADIYKKDHNLNIN